MGRGEGAIDGLIKLCVVFKFFVFVFSYECSAGAKKVLVIRQTSFFIAVAASHRKCFREEAAVRLDVVLRPPYIC